jgi:hypothetical protein
MMNGGQEMCRSVDLVVETGVKGSMRGERENHLLARAVFVRVGFFVGRGKNRKWKIENRKRKRMVSQGWVVGGAGGRLG